MRGVHLFDSGGPGTLINQVEVIDDQQEPVARAALRQRIGDEEDQADQAVETGPGDPDHDLLPPLSLRLLAELQFPRKRGDGQAGRDQALDGLGPARGPLDVDMAGLALEDRFELIHVAPGELDEVAGDLLVRYELSDERLEPGPQEVEDVAHDFGRGHAIVRPDPDQLYAGPSLGALGQGPQGRGDQVGLAHPGLARDRNDATFAVLEARVDVERQQLGLVGSAYEQAAGQLEVVVDLGIEEAMVRHVAGGQLGHSVSSGLGRWAGPAGSASSGRPRSRTGR